MPLTVGRFKLIREATALPNADELKLKHKVFAYVTRGTNLLVFDHPGHPEAGTQVPAGTRALTEDPVVAVMREAKEETGLDGLELRRFLGEDNFPVPERGELHRRRFYHLRCTGEAPSRWEHYEEHPSDGSTEPILFVLYWVDLRNGLPALAPGHGQMLSSLLEFLSS